MRVSQQFSLASMFLLIAAYCCSGCSEHSTAPPTSPAEESGSSESTEEDSKAAAESGKTEPSAEQKQQPLQFVQKLSQEKIDEGWIALFDNETLFGWTANSDANWSVSEESVGADQGESGLLLTDVRFADFELMLEFQASPGSNGGVFIRCVADTPDPHNQCYEVNIADGHPEGFDSGSIVFHQRGGAAEPTTDNKWHSMTIAAAGNLISILVDGKQVVEYTDESENWLKAGKIGLQRRDGNLRYRNIRLRPLGMQPLFNGVDLAGWREVPGSQSVIDVVEETIHVVNGPGFLETKETFQDFALQFEARTNAPELNSGLFFRAQPGTEEAPSHGYEVQIHNGIKEDDRNQPANAGTGAIFRRVDARRVVSRDEEWSTITLVADGPQIATWVNGYPVVNWRDEREADPNPRKGLRLEAGHLSLQGHDPTTDMSFRDIQVQRLP